MNGEISFGPMGSAIPDDPYDAEAWASIGTVDNVMLDAPVNPFRDTAPVVLNRRFRATVKVVVTEISKSWEDLLTAVLGAKAGIETYARAVRALERRERHTANARRNRLRRKRRARRRKRG